MTPSDADAIVALNDRALEWLVRASAEGAEDEIGRLVAEVAAPIVQQILSRYGRIGMIPRGDEDDVAATVYLHLLEKLRRVRMDREEPINDFSRYVAALTYNAVNDHLRRRFPERARLKNRLRYGLTRDSRLALWEVGGILVCGLTQWSGSTDIAFEVPIEMRAMTRTMQQRDNPGDALAAIFAAAGRPLSFDALVNFAAAIWRIADLPPLELTASAASASDLVSMLESRDFLQGLWREIRALRPQQRKALLLNLRDGETANVASLLVLTGVARFDDLAAALDMTPESLAALWHDLPLDDRRIADLLGLTRQQVINLRKAARDRLKRRLDR